jgi:hypothetical protein
VKEIENGLEVMMVTEKERLRVMVLAILRVMKWVLMWEGEKAKEWVKTRARVWAV